MLSTQYDRHISLLPESRVLAFNFETVKAISDILLVFSVQIETKLIVIVSFGFIQTGFTFPAFHFKFKFILSNYT